MKTLLPAAVLMMVGASVQASPKVGVYYYPWYGGFAGGHATAESLRNHLVPSQNPAIGSYSNRAASTIEAHLDQSQQGNIDFWALSWWGPNSAEERTIRDYLLVHQRAEEIEYAIHYESTGRLGPFENPDFSRLVPDFRYLAENYFGRDEYLHINGRPVVFLYVTRAYFNSPESYSAVAQLRETIQSEYGYDPYLIGDDIFTGPIDLERAQLWDAITDFDVYGTALQGHGSTNAALDVLANIYDGALAAANGLEIGFIPTASPGFNDSAVRDGHPAAPRYLVDDAVPQEGSLFSRMLAEVVVPRTDPRADDILMINSFNEWHEDTQIENSNIAPPTNQDDSPDERYAQGYNYAGYGGLYLDLLREATVMDVILTGDLNCDGRIDFDDIDAFVLGLNDPAAYQIAFEVPAALKGDTDADTDLDFDDIEGFIAILTGTPFSVPEPTGLAPVAIGILALAGWARRALGRLSRFAGS